MSQSSDPFGFLSPEVDKYLTQLALQNLTNNALQRFGQSFLQPPTRMEPPPPPQIFVDGSVESTWGSAYLRFQEGEDSVQLEISNDYRDSSVNLTPKMVRGLHQLLQEIIAHPAFEALELKEAVKSDD